MKNNSNITSLEDILDLKYGPLGTEARENWEQRYEAFKIGVLIEEARKSKNMTQAELAAKIGTNKSYISRIENDSSDSRLSTRFRIIHEGLGGHSKLKVEF